LIREGAIVMAWEWDELRIMFLFRHQRIFLSVFLVSYFSIAVGFSMALGRRILLCFEAEYYTGEVSFGDMYYLLKS